MALLWLLLALFALAASVDEDVERYIAIFRGNPMFHASAAESLAWMGLPDTRLYDVIEERLRTDYPVPREMKTERARIAWYIRALGFSGQEKYAPTIQTFLQDRDYVGTRATRSRICPTTRSGIPSSPTASPSIPG